MSRLSDERNWEAVKSGVSDSWDFWLSQHDYSTPECIVRAVREAVADWLADHGDVVLHAMCDEIRRWADG